MPAERKDSGAQTTQKERRIDRDEGYSYKPPPSFMYVDSGELGKRHTGFVSGRQLWIFVREDSFSGSLKEYLEKNYNTKTKEGVKVEIFGPDEFKSDSDAKGMRSLIETTAEGKKEYRRVYVFQGRKGKVIVFYCDFPLSVSGDIDTIFSDSMKTFRLEP